MITKVKMSKLSQVLSKCYSKLCPCFFEWGKKGKKSTSAGVQRGPIISLGKGELRRVLSADSVENED